MKKYEAYKDSGIDWIGEIPEHWIVKKLRYVFHNLNAIRVPLSAEERGGMKSKTYDYYGASGIIDKVDNYLFEGKTILIGEDGANLFTRSKRLSFIADGKYWVNNHAHIIKPRNGNIQYFCELLELIDYTTYISGSAQPKLTQEALMSIKILDPPNEEQTHIANYLDQKTTQLDTLISKKEKLIELLQEERTAIINHAVTKGLDPNVPMKDSGIEWLGEIPEHWEVKKLKYVCKVISNKSNTKPNYIIALENIESWTGRVLGKSNIETLDGDVNLFQSGDILFNKLRPYLAKVVLTKQSGGCVGELLILRPTTGVDSEFLFYRMISEAMITIIDGSTYGTKMPRASWEKFISQILVGIPDAVEQTKIVNYIKEQNSRIELIIIKTQQEIELLKEYKTALISEVVTGKIDVRDEIIN